MKKNRKMNKGYSCIVYKKVDINELFIYSKMRNKFIFNNKCIRIVICKFLIFRLVNV